MPKRAASKHTRGLSELATRPEVRDAIAEAAREVGRQLQALRSEKQWTQETAAEAAGIHEKYLSRVENGSANPSLGVLVALARAYEVPVSRLFGGADG